MTYIIKCINIFLRTVGITFLFHCQTYGKEITIEPSGVATVLENKTTSWTCNYAFETENIITRRLEKKSYNGTFLNVVILKYDCQYFYAAENYTYSCNTTTFSITNEYVRRSDHLSKWRCRFGFNNSDENKVSANSALKVQIPTSNVDITEPTDNLTFAIENKRFIFICNTSDGFPEATISWFNDSKTPFNITDDKKITTGFSSSSEPDKYPFSVGSELQLYPSKHDNETRIYCEARNTAKEAPVISDRKPLLYVQYPPTSPQFFINSLEDIVKAVSVIWNNPISISCRSRSDPKSVYTWTFPNKTLIKNQVLTFNKVQKEDDGKYYCMAENQMKTSNGNTTTGTNESYVQLSVLFPPDKPSLYYHIENVIMKITRMPLKVVKGDTIKISCNSTGKPHPYSYWNGNKTNSEILKTSVNSNISFSCKTTNMMNDTLGNVTHGTSETSLTIQAMYPPKEPKLQFIKDSITEILVSRTLRIIENNTFTLRCLGESDPFPSYHWTNTSISDSLIINSIQRHQSRLFTCNVSNVMERTFGEKQNGRNSTSISVEVLYPPDIPALYFYINDDHPKKLNGFQVDVVRGDTFTLLCNSTGNPPTSSWWNGRQPQNDTLVLKSITYDVTSTCRSENILNATGGASTKGSSQVDLTINVMFPPSITITINNRSGLHAINNMTIKENSNFTLTCTANSNPPSQFHWKSPKSISRQFDRHLRIYNISRSEPGPYICYAQNTMNRSFGKMEDGKSNQSLYFDIVYKTTIKSFASTDHQYHRNITMNVADSVYLLCNVESNPKSNIVISFNEEVLNDTTGSDRLFLRLSEANCSNAGIYVCSGENEYNYGSNARREFIVYVKCKPQPSPGMGLMKNISAALYSSKTLRFRVLPYLDSGVTTFKWLKHDQPEDINKAHSGRIFVRSSSIESNLTINSILESDFGEYLVVYNNSVGTSTFTFFLQGEKAQVHIPTESHPSSMVGIVAGTVSSIVIILTITGIIIGVFINRRRYKNETGRLYQNVPIIGAHINNQRSSDNLQIEETLFEGLQEVDDVPIVTNERTEYCNSPDIIENIDRIKVTELFSYVSGRSEESFEADYQKLPTELKKPCTFARKPENIALNRYNGIYPYDHSRVILDGEPAFFINASYINGYKSSKAYIASLGPTAKTTDGFKVFWKMIWSERVDVIVMLTNLREASGMKCEKYWSEGGATVWYGDMCVSNETTECFSEYTVRQFSVSKGEECRSLTHLHYTAWPDKTVPEDVTSLIEFRQRMKTTPTSSDGPVVVHCSAGIGRTGTFIALDMLIEEGKDKGSLNVFECVGNMREQRVKMVQTFEQYMYIYKALVIALTFDCETIPVETFNEYVDATNNNMYSMMFQQSRQSVETDSKTDVEARLKNEKLTDKNRLGADIPGSRFRAMLYLNRTDEGSEYINAVYINSFVKKNNFISAQSPLLSTVADFLTMVYQEDCSCIATMEDLKDPGMTVGQYLPDDKKTLTVGNFKVSSSRLETKHHYVVRKMKIKYSGKFDSGEKIIYHFQYTKWMTGHDTPMHAKEFVQFVNEVKEYANELGEERSHVIVHCLKANERSGLFCALAILMEKVKLERQVNVLNTVRHLRTRRQTAITSMEQLKFCFQATSEYIKLNMLG